ncbi:MAG: aldo/keto reductase [Bacteroidetes bacterium]|nr:aldo/keto reductase [Bacteroidota bacterium]MCL5026497.1 aldo/keto reductase [Chloroflexota bacterium]
MLEKVPYGNTGLTVTRLCFGTGQMGHSRFKTPIDEGARLIRLAYDLGVNFFDTALSYGTHPHVAHGLRGTDRSRVVISTKTNAKTRADAEAQIEMVQEELETDYVDVFLMHSVRTEADYEARQGVLEALCRAKERGITRHVGASSHIYSGQVMRRLIDDPRIEVILTLGSKDMLGLRGATPDQQRAFIAEAGGKGKAVCLMKVLGEGRHAADAEECMRAALAIPGAAAFTVGMVNEAQVRMAVKVVAGEPVPEDLRSAALKGAEVEWARTFPDHYD